jgi:hypothetical protein
LVEDALVKRDVIRGIKTERRDRRRSYSRRVAKIGRNAPCPCGSGKKYKKCCEAEPVRKTRFAVVSGGGPEAPTDLLIETEDGVAVRPAGHAPHDGRESG